MPKYMIERQLPGAGQLSADELHAISEKSNKVIGTLGRRSAGCRASWPTT
jgi:hypothetical protein